MFFSTPYDRHFPKCHRAPVKQLPDSNLSVVEVGYSRIPGGMRHILKKDTYTLYYVTGGKGFFRGFDLSNEKGFLVLPNDDDFALSDLEDPYECYWISFMGDDIQKFLLECGLTDRPCAFAFAKQDECVQILKHFLFDSKPLNESAEAFMLYAAFYDIMALHVECNQEIVVFDKSSTPFTTDLPVAQTVEHFLEKNYNQHIKIADLAKGFHISRNYMYSVFKQEYGVSPQEYLLNLRVEKSKILLLKYRALSIHEISYSVGIDDSLYFSRVFRKRVGVTPSQYRKLHRKENGKKS